MSRLIPARSSSPSRILQREIKARGWSGNDLAERMDCSLQIADGLISGNTRINAKTAEQLAKAIGTSEEFWINLER